MSVECSECERSVYAGHVDDCWQRPKCLPGTDYTYTHRWKIEASDWDDLPDDVVGCATCQDCGDQQFVFRCEWESSPKCTGKAVSGDACLECRNEEI